MKKVVLQYNPFTIETTITIDGEPISMDGVLYSHRNNRLQEWLGKLFPELVEECNDEIELTFKGTQLDFEDVYLAVQEYLNSADDNKVSIKLVQRTSSRSAEERLDELLDLFNEMQDTCPFSDLKTEELRRQFKHAVDSKVEISVIANMSSGKSTLINSLLGRELLPSKNKNCTAKVAHIKDVDGLDGFSAICKNEKGEVIEENDNLQLEDMESYNEDPEIADIYIKGDIPFVSSQNMQLILLDTPGPNNGRNEEHERRTLRAIKSEDMPMILFVLDATKIATNDDKNTFENVANVMKKYNTKQARDRFIFVLNKADVADPEKRGDTVEDLLEEAKCFLEENGIENANIFPVSAEIAKNIRMYKNNDEKEKLTTKKLNALNTDIGNLEPDAMHLNKYAPLSASGEYIMNQEIKTAQMNGDIYNEALVYTGIPALEIAIAEYLEKYALTRKIHEAVNTFRTRIEEKQLMAKLEEEISINEQMRQDVKQKMNALYEQLKDGKETKKFREELEKLDFDNLPTMIARDIAKKYTSKLSRIKLEGAEGEMTIESATNYINGLRKQITAWEQDLQTDLEKMIDQSIVKNSKIVVDRYSQHIKNLLEDKKIKTNIYDFDVSFKIMTAHLPSTLAVVNRYKETRNRKVKVGEVTVSDDFELFRPMTWFGLAKHKEDVFENRSYQVVNGKGVAQSFIAPLQMSFDNNINSAKDEAKRQANDFKKYFISELDKLDAVIVKKTKELASAASDEAYLNDELKRNRDNQIWLSNFQEGLEAIINL